MDIFIVKKIWSEKEKRYLTFNEMINSNVVNYVDTKQYFKAGLVPIENSEQEILDLVKEMNERIDGKWKESKSLFSKDSSCYGLTAKIGSKFLMENKEMLL